MPGIEGVKNTRGAALGPLRYWLPHRQASERTRLRLFCFPHAGGSAEGYAAWSNALPPEIEVCAVELPGRGRHRNEQAFTQLKAMLPVLAGVLMPLTDRPFALFGHSMGALIAFELSHHLRWSAGVSPEHLFASGCPAPHLRSTRRPTSELPDAELVRELHRLNGTPPEVLDNPELLEIVLPLVRADLAVVDTYRYAERPPLPCPITGLGGIEDPDALTTELQAWDRQTAAAFTMQMFPGDHFYLHGARASVLQQLVHDLGNHLDVQ